MRAAVYHGARDVRIEAVPEPGDPGPEELLLEVRRAAICGTDVSEWAHGPYLVPLETPHPGSGRAGPTVLGHEFVGQIVARGEGVSGFEVGSRVVPGAGVSCGSCRWCAQGRPNLCARYYTLGLQADGGLAEYVLAPASICQPVPASCSDDAATVAQPLAVALHAVRRGSISSGETVALTGVGGIGAFILAAAVRRGASPLIAIDIDEQRLETARRLGATHLVNARAADPVKAVHDLTDGVGADAVIEASGAAPAAAAAFRTARRGGRVVLVGLQAQPNRIDLADLTLREVDVVTTVAHVCDVDLPEAIETLATTPLAEVVVDRVIDLAALVPEGLEALERGAAKGKVLVDTAA